MRVPKLSNTTLHYSIGALALAIILGNIYVLGRAANQDNALTLFPYYPEEVEIRAAAGGVPMRTMVATTTTEPKNKGIGSFIKALFNQNKNEPAPVVSDPVPPTEDPTNSGTPPEPEPELELEPEPEQELELMPEEEELYEYEEEWPVEEIPETYEELSWPPATEEEWYAPEVPLEPTTLEDFSPLELPVVPIVPLRATNKPPAPKVAPMRTVRTGALPDLYVGEVTPLFGGSYTNAPAGEPFGLNLRVDNAGSRESSPFTTRIRVDEQADGSWDAETAIPPQGILPFGTSQRIIASDAVAETVPGRAIVEICVDSAGVIVEKNERNNCRTIELTVAAAAPKPAQKPSVIQSVYQSFLNLLGGV